MTSNADKMEKGLAPFVRSDCGVHPVIDYEALERFYPEITHDIWNVSSASDLISWEQMRHLYGIEDRKAIPCDVFVWGKGCPPDLRMTRVGGTPFLPKKTPWPTVEDAVTQFLCQFDFRDSFDLVNQTVSRKLPGDILLIFVADQDALISGDEEKMRFVWVSADESDSDIVEAADIPTPTHPFECISAWGTRFRTVDVPSKWHAAFEEIPDDASRGRSWQLPVYWATKIGGVPFDSQEPHRTIPANYLCQITSIQPSHQTKWPWVNSEAPLSLSSKEHGIHAKQNCLMIGDLGELTFYLSKAGDISVSAASS